MTTGPAATPGTRILPAEFTTAAHTMSEAFTTGTDAECQAAADHLTRLLHDLDPDLTPQADQLLTSLAAAAAAQRAADRVADQLAAAVLTGTRRLTPGAEVRTLTLADGAEVAVVVPIGHTAADTAVRAALLTGSCPDCAARLSGDWQVHHTSVCVTQAP